MMILALEFSSSVRSVALLEHENLSHSARLLAVASNQGSQDAGPLPLIERTLALAGLRPELVETIVVGLGPGSYTGIRSALALAQGWQLARDVKLAGISSVEAMAWQAQEQGWFGRVNFVIDAQRNELYLVEYEISREKRQLLEPLRLIAVNDARAKAGQDDVRVAGPEARRWFPQADILHPEAAPLGHLLPSSDFVPGEQLEPIYLRETSFVKAPPPRTLPA
jgi:tRNA threonylcarbamoyl adenosine modification protein YeaZ